MRGLPLQLAHQIVHDLFEEQRPCAVVAGAALADAHHAETLPAIERYQQRTVALGHAAVHAATAAASSADDALVPALLAEANPTIAEQIRTATDALLGEVLATASTHMTNRFSRSDG
ncbi:hypothetical protein [Brachybacterium sp. AOP35-5H-19]|uniref:hypothetical protein n=1 Tax=Brachybacterium sp. AOP35-5H-19 TaxID=3457685 RepID=UPI004034D329